MLCGSVKSCVGDIGLHFQITEVFCSTVCVFALSLALMPELEVMTVIVVGVFTFECFLLCHICTVNCS